MHRPTPRLFLVRHGETEWSMNGRHTSLTDLPLTLRGEDIVKSRSNAIVGKGKLLDPDSMCHIFVSPRQRAQKTFQLLFSSLPNPPSHETTEEVREWDYGSYEGMITSDIRKSHRDWDIFRDGCPGGESVEEMTKRMDGVVAKIRDLHRKYSEEGIGQRDVLIVSHGHFCRCLIARWLDNPLTLGAGINVETGGVTLLSYNHNKITEPAITGLNLYAM